MIMNGSTCSTVVQNAACSCLSTISFIYWRGVIYGADQSDSEERNKHDLALSDARKFWKLDIWPRTLH